MALRRGVVDMGDDAAPRMRTSRISSHYQGTTTVSNSKSSRRSLSNTGGLSRKPLMDRNAPVKELSSSTRKSSTTKPMSSRTLSSRTSGTEQKRNARNGNTNSCNVEKPKHGSVQDKENATKTTKTKLSSKQKKSTSGLRTHSKPTTISTSSTTTPATKMRALTTASKKVMFTPATRTENRGSDVNSLRRSLRESITPPKSNLASRTQTSNLVTSHPLPLSDKTTTLTDQSITANPLSLSLPSQSFDSPDDTMVAFSTTPSVSENIPQLPKTPKSILKDQLDMSMDESMLLSPGTTSLLPFHSHPSTSAFTSMRIDEDDELLFASPPAKEKTPASRFFKDTDQEEVESSIVLMKRSVEDNKPTKEGKQRSLTVDNRLKGGIFSASKRSSQRNIQQQQSIKQAAVFVATPNARTVSVENDVASKTESLPELKTERKVQPCETPHIQNTNQIIAQQEAVPEATPFNQRGNGVCMDLTSIFFNEPKTVRKTNKSEKLLKEKNYLPKESSTKIAERSVSADEAWAEKQCDTFSKWLNFTLQPNEDIHRQEEAMFMGDADSKIAGEIVTPNSSAALRTLILHQRMAKARGAGSALFESADLKKVQATIKSEVAKGKLSLRADRNLHLDLTQRKKVISLLLSYSTPWLRLGLETMFSENILPEVPSQFSPMKRGNGQQSRNTPTYRLRLALRDFIVTKVLSDASVLAKYTKGKCKVPSGNFEKRYHAEIGALVLRRLLTLIFFLDRAKAANILEQSPRLFTNAAPVKSSREVLISFCRDFLAAEGDITKHLGRVGLKVTYKQDPIDEIDVSVSNFAVDLRDGIRLAKLSEILTTAPPKSLLRACRIPAMSRLQKIHNVGTALEALRKSGVGLSEDIAPHQIVDGNRSMVLKLMWTIIAHYCFPAVLDFDKVEEEIIGLRRQLFAKQIMTTRVPTAEFSAATKSPQIDDRGKDVLLRWCQSVCALFGIKIADFSVSFADGRALATIVHYYHPKMLPLNEIRATTNDMTNKQSRRRLSLDQARYNETLNSKLAHTRLAELGGIPNMMPTTNTTMVPDEKSMMVYLCYACSRLLDSRREVNACLLIQKRYRTHYQRKLLLRQRAAASVILREWKMRKATYYQNQRDKYASPVAIIVKFVRSRRAALKAMKILRLETEQRYTASVLIQVQVRGLLAKRQVSVLRSRYMIALNIQCFFRGRKARQRVEVFFQKTTAAIQLQSLWRGYASRKNVLFTMRSIILVQAMARKSIAQRRFRAFRKASFCIQKIWRAFWGQLQYQMDLMDIIAVQSIARRKNAIRLRCARGQAAETIQLAARCFLARGKLLLRRQAAQARSRDHSSAIICQSVIRAFLANRKTSGHRLKFVAVVLIQREWRGKLERLQSKRRVRAVKIIQTAYRTCRARRTFVTHLSSARTLQVCWRSFAKHRIQQRILLLQSLARRWLAKRAKTSRKNAVVVVQRAVRCFLTDRRAQEKAQLRSKSVTLIQSNLRRHSAKQSYETKRASANSIQSWWRSVLKRSAVKETIKSLLKFGRSMTHGTSAAAVLLQKQWRAFKAAGDFHQKKELAVLLAAHFRGNSVRSYQRSLGQHAVKIQSLVRRHLATIERNSSTSAILQIQGWWRASNTARHYQIKKVKTVKLQGWIREQLSRCKVKKEFLLQATISSMVKQGRCQSLSMSDASRKVQSQWRSYQIRSHFLQVHAQVVALQALTRGFLARVHRHRQMCHIVAIQALVRQKMHLRRYDSLRYGVKLLQSIIRSKRMKAEYGAMKSKVTLLQAFARGWLTRQHQSRQFCCAMVIQSEWRRSLDRGKYQRFLRGLVLCQGLYRLSIAHSEFQTKVQATKEIQRNCRGWLAKNKLHLLKEQKAQRETDGALALQSLYRSYIVRKDIQGLHEKAALIQRKWTGFLTMLDFRLTLFDIVTVQSVARRWLAKKNAASRNNAIVLAQSVTRGWLSSRIAKKEFSRMLEVRRIQKSAVHIQAFFRGHAAKVVTARERAARDIQKCWRCYNVHVEFLIVLLGTMQFQANVRGFIARTSYKAKQKAALCIQASHRGLLGRKIASIKKDAVIRLQANVKMMLARVVFHRQIETRRYIAAVNIQKIWRGYSEFCWYLEVEFSALSIQQVARAYLARRLRSHLVEEKRRVLLPIAAATIQGAVRAYLAKGAFQRMVRQVKSFQALVRGHRARRKRGKRMRITASRLKQASLRATKTPNLRLGARTIEALTVLQTSTRLAEIMTAICTLELSTRYSRSCCEAMAHAKCTGILLSLIRQCNRSRPHQELLTFVLLTLKNVAQHENLLRYVATVTAAEILLDLIQMFRDAACVFCPSISLLLKCINYDEECKEICRTTENMKRLRGIHTLCKKKLRSTSRRKSVLAGLGSPDPAKSIKVLQHIIVDLEA